MAIERILVLNVFDGDLKALKKKHRRLSPLWDAVDAIVNDDRQVLSTRYRDHPLTGQWNGYRELHVEGDWLLIYTVDNDILTLVLTRTGTHDELFSKRVNVRSYRKRNGRVL